MDARSRWRSVRQEDTRTLHALAGRLRRQLAEGQELSEGQDAWWDEIIRELVWRSARRRRGFTRCTCDLCVASV